MCLIAVKEDFKTKRKKKGWVVVHAFNPNTWEAEAGGSVELRANLIYTMSSRTATVKPYLRGKGKREILQEKY